MTQNLRGFVAAELATPVGPEIVQAAMTIADRLGGAAVLFYGSVLRTGDLDGVLDFYVLTDHIAGRGIRRLATRYLWPDVSYVELEIAGRIIRAKIAAMPLAIFRRASSGAMLDTTIWTRFTQPAALIWSASEMVGDAVVDAVADAAVTAARFAAALGEPTDTPSGFWRQLFRNTYKAELRVEQPGREEQIIAFAQDHYDRLLPLAWQAAGIAYRQEGSSLTPALSARERRDLLSKWAARRRAGKPLNVARLLKASFTFDGAARYGLWKLERHTGVRVPLTPWRERHPVLAAPGVLWRVWRSRRSA